MNNLPIIYSADKRGNVVPKPLDGFETVRMDMDSEPKYYGNLHSEGRFIIRLHQSPATLPGGATDQHITFYFSSDGESLSTVWANRASLSYVEWDNSPWK